MKPIDFVVYLDFADNTESCGKHGTQELEAGGSF